MDSRKKNKMGEMPVGRLVFTMSLPLMVPFWFSHFIILSTVFLLPGLVRRH